MENEIIETYRQTNSVEATWRKFTFKNYTRKRITEILREAGELNSRGGCRYKEPALVPNDNPKYRLWNDDTLDFEAEIKTALY